MSGRPTEPKRAWVCWLSQGCTHLLSSGEDVGPAAFLGASREWQQCVLCDGGTARAAGDADEFHNIYDARVDGGFAPPSPTPECLSCQGVGSPPPLFSTPASVSFAGAGNPTRPSWKKAEAEEEDKSKHEAEARERHKGKSKAARRDVRPGRASRRGRRS